MNQTTKPNKFYVTTPIYYINDRPHVGHAYSTIAADVLARYWRGRLGSGNVMFSTGIDENSKKTIEAAELVGKSIVEYTNQMAGVWKNTWDALCLSYDDFIRTSEPRHKAAVEHMLTKIQQADDISKGYYEGPYCYRCEQFYRDDELIGDNCPVHKKPVEIVKEENYFFDLPKYAEQLKTAILNEEMEILPQSRRNEVLAFIDRGLEKISISRANQDIGLELPFDRTQKIYVWVEALINYLTVAGYPDDSYEDWWGNLVHIVGKDIIKFHCIIWPAMLMSAGIAIPKRVFAHGFFTLDGEKISKSTGNTIDPVEMVEKYGNDALRYYLLREIPFGSDGDFSQDRFKVIYESELGNDLGNLVQRVAVMTNKYCQGEFALSEVRQVNSDPDKLVNLEFDASLRDIFGVIQAQNQKIEQHKPWELAKTDPQAVSRLLNEIIEHIMGAAQRLEPFLPDTSAKIQATFKDGKVNMSVGVIFPRID